MGVSCLVPAYGHYSSKSTCRLFRIPMDESNLNRWNQISNLTDELIQSNKNARVRSCHFKYNKKPVHLDVMCLRQATTQETLSCNGDEHEMDASGDQEVVFNFDENQSLCDTTPWEANGINLTENIENVNSVVENLQDFDGGNLNENETTFNYISYDDYISVIDEHNQNILESQAENDKLKQIIQDRDVEIYELNKSIRQWQTENVQCKGENVALQKNILLYQAEIDEVKQTIRQREVENNALKKSIQKCQVENEELKKSNLTMERRLITVRFGIEFIQHSDKLMNMKCLPNVFASFSACRIILDASEIMSDKPLLMSLQRLTFSAYKRYNTWKALFGVAPNGVITYVSNLYPGSTSDKKMVEHCGVTKQLIPGDLVIADRGFLIHDSLPNVVNLNLPPFLTMPQFTESQVNQIKNIARARVHVEHAINKTKNFRILDHISAENYSIINEIFQVCAMLTNFQNPLISESAHLL